MSTTVCNVKKSVSVPECFGEQTKQSTDPIYYEEAWDLRMARLGVDIAQLNDEFIDKVEITNDDDDFPEPPVMIKSCTESYTESSSPIKPKLSASNNRSNLISMTSSAIADSVIANNPVYSFKKYSSTDPNNKPNNTQPECDTNRSIRRSSAHEVQHEQHISSSQQSNLQSKSLYQTSGLLLNNNCYELTYITPMICQESPSQLINAIVDNTAPISNSHANNRMQFKTTRYKTSSCSSSTSSTQTQPKIGVNKQMSTPAQTNNGICNNLCYNNENEPATQSNNFSTMPMSGYSRQISAPVDINAVYQNRAQEAFGPASGIAMSSNQPMKSHPATSSTNGNGAVCFSSPEWPSSQHSRRSMKKVHNHHKHQSLHLQPSQQFKQTNLYDVANSCNTNTAIANSNNTNNVWCGIQKTDTNNNSNMDNYIKHLKGKDIARDYAIRNARRHDNNHGHRLMNADDVIANYGGVSSIMGGVNIQNALMIPSTNGNNNSSGHMLHPHHINDNLIQTMKHNSNNNRMNNVPCHQSKNGHHQLMSTSVTSNNHNASNTSTIPRCFNSDFNDPRLDMIADSNRNLQDHLWFHPRITRIGAEELLSKYPEGSFLVRPSQSCVNDEYSLSIRYKQKWLHMKITRDIDDQYVLGQYSQPYPTIPDMIRHYSRCYLPVKGANLISLTQPVFRR